MIKDVSIGNWKGNFLRQFSEPPIPSEFSQHWLTNPQAHIYYMRVTKLTFGWRHSRRVAYLHQCRCKYINPVTPKGYTVQCLTISLEKRPFSQNWSKAILIEIEGILIEIVKYRTIHKIQNGVCRVSLFLQ